MIFLVSFIIILILITLAFVRGAILSSKTEEIHYEKIVEEIKEVREEPFDGVIIKEKSIVYSPSKDIDSILKNGEDQFFD